MKQLPLICRDDFEQPWLVTASGELTVAEVLFRAKSLSQQLPDGTNCLLLCEQRVNFIIGFLAALWRGQTVMLPPNRSVDVARSLLDDYPDSYCLTDTTENVCGRRQLIYDYAVAEAGICTEIPLLDTGHLACRVFTSGSTGKPVVHEKFWGDLVTVTALLRTHYAFEAETYIVATIPAQHMYGLETTVLVPMMYPVSVYAGMPFFPDDIRSALSRRKQNIVFVTTPLHLKVCAQAGLVWPQARQMISATAPLSRQDAETAERLFGAELKEIYGSTESGAIALRRTACEQSWTLYDGVKLNIDGDMAQVVAAHIPQQPVLADRIEAVDRAHFMMHGRLSDMVKIAGKRASLEDLNLRLNSIPGIEDGVILQNEVNADGIARLCALVVAPQLSAKDVKRALAEQIDPVFMPRPVIKVDTLPRNETGKLPHAEMMKLLKTGLSQ